MKQEKFVRQHVYYIIDSVVDGEWGEDDVFASFCDSMDKTEIELHVEDALGISLGGMLIMNETPRDFVRRCTRRYEKKIRSAEREE